MDTLKWIHWIHIKGINWASPSGRNCSAQPSTRWIHVPPPAAARSAAPAAAPASRRPAVAADPRTGLCGTSAMGDDSEWVSKMENSKKENSNGKPKSWGYSKKLRWKTPKKTAESMNIVRLNFWMGWSKTGAQKLQSQVMAVEKLGKWRQSLGFLGALVSDKSNLGVSLNWPNHVISYSYQDVTHAAWSLGPLPLFDFFVVPSHSMQRYEEELLQRTNKHQTHQHQWWITSRIGGHGSILLRICCLFPWICADFHWLYIVIHPSFPSFPSPNASYCSMPLWRGTFLMGNSHYCILYWGCLVQSDFQLATIHKVHAVDDFCLSCWNATFWRCRPPFLKHRLGHENGPRESSLILKIETSFFFHADMTDITHWTIPNLEFKQEL